MRPCVHGPYTRATLCRRPTHFSRNLSGQILNDRCPLNRQFRVINRGVQYEHCVMHKCIMVKVGGKRKTRKVCKENTRNFYEIRGEF